MADLVIIGNGVAGTTVARHVRKHSDRDITIISSESRHFYSRPALMYLYMGHMKYDNIKPYEDWFWEKNRLDLMFDYVRHIDTDNKKLTLANTADLHYNQLVLATGSKSNYFGWPGQNLQGVQGLYSLQDLELMEDNTREAREAVVIGGGLIGIEMAEMLLTRGIKVTFLVREDRYWGNVLRREEGELIGRHVAEHHVDLRLATELDAILGDDGGRVRAIRTKSGEEIPCQFVGLTAGVHPNIDLVRDSSIQHGRGIRVNTHLETNVPDVFACGDCAEIIEGDAERGRIEPLWYTGKMQAEALAQTLVGKRTEYDRGIWFNSAKFFDIEYHTYGFVAAEPRDCEETFYWEHPDGKQCMRLVYHRDDGRLIGMNSFGIRYRHRVFERWLAENRTVAYVLTHLNEANFDPEFFKRFEREMVAAYNQTAKTPIQLKRRKVLGIF
ncbi:NAD(P)/FAD-dependent oxidoreductase [Acanthopleuribacter pedis]|uniref:NAD(P)/FAD-dependent oxidoreductase n=1 Tax=Acanthopleuribacter pedis TaxID=442870 RepID=A0A8J7Q0R9_9BACT|nr:FAD-dependent oxidoreductase [Acanthopleuribacter pedis]MBO1317115.1 NAD(P)/FAD-dependent oxidoreductase [Acanthopleuribacter pedis]